MGGRIDALEQSGDVLQRNAFRAELMLTGGQMIIEPRQNLTLLGHFIVHPAYAVNDTSIPAGENQVGVPTHDFQGKMHARCRGIGGEQQPGGALFGTEQEYHLIPGGLIDFIQLCSKNMRFQLFHNGRKGNGIKWHGDPP